MALAAEMVRREALRWLTSEHVSVLGQQVTASIDRYQQQHRRSPTWAEALAGVDPELLSPIHTIPDGFPLRPALWRLELRQRLMIELRRVRWISYSRNTRSLHPGDHGRGWLTTQNDAHRDPTAVPTISAPSVIPTPSGIPPRRTTTALVPSQ